MPRTTRTKADREPLLTEGYTPTEMVQVLSSEVHRTKIDTSKALSDVAEMLLNAQRDGVIDIQDIAERISHQAFMIGPGWGARCQYFDGHRFCGFHDHRGNTEPSGAWFCRMHRTDLD